MKAATTNPIPITSKTIRRQASRLATPACSHLGEQSGISRDIVGILVG
jgi:hypothetical protein